MIPSAAVTVTVTVLDPGTNASTLAEVVASANISVVEASMLIDVEP